MSSGNDPAQGSLDPSAAALEPLDATAKSSKRLYINTKRYRDKVGYLVKAYCVKCKKSIEMKDAKKVKLKNGKPATKGICPKCGTKVFRIGE